MKNHSYSFLSRLALPGLMSLIFLAPAIAGAGTISLTVSLVTTNPLPGSTGNVFDILIINSDPTSYSIGAFAFAVQTNDPTDITLTSADTLVTVPLYIFAGASFDVDTASPLYSLSSGELIGSDLWDASGGAALGSGATLALAEVFYSVSPGATPGHTFTISFDPTFDSLANSSGTELPVNDSNIQTITFGTPATAPEPSAGMLLAAGLIGLACRAFFARRFLLKP
jgi:hypothetical protein